MNNGKNENDNSSNNNAELSDEQKKALQQQEEDDKKASESGDVAVLQEHNKKLYTRTKNSETEAKELKQKNKDLQKELDELKNGSGGNGGKKITKNNKEDSEDSLTDDEIRLLAKGMEDDEIAQLKVIAKGLDKPLPEAAKSDLFAAWQAKRKADKAKEDAKLGGSNGSGKAAPKNTFKPGMTDAEHKEAFKRRQRGEE